MDDHGSTIAIYPVYPYQNYNISMFELVMYSYSLYHLVGGFNPSEKHLSLVNQPSQIKKGV